jgi:hypothetical protein
MTFVEEEDVALAPAVPEPPRKSVKEKRKEKKKSATLEFEGRFVIQLKTSGSEPTAAVVEEEGRLVSTNEILTATTVHSAEDGAVLAMQRRQVYRKMSPKTSY